MAEKFESWVRYSTKNVLKQARKKQKKNFILQNVQISCFVQKSFLIPNMYFVCLYSLFERSYSYLPHYLRHSNARETRVAEPLSIWTNGLYANSLICAHMEVWMSDIIILQTASYWLNAATVRLDWAYIFVGYYRSIFLLAYSILPYVRSASRQANSLLARSCIPGILPGIHDRNHFTPKWELPVLETFFPFCWWPF